MKIELLIKKAEDGVNSLPLNKKYKESAMENLKEWLSGKDEFSPYKEQIISWIKKEKWEIIVDSFFQVIPFGTGGRRGLVGIGTNRINDWTIKNSAQGHSQYLLKKHPDAKERGIVIAYGVRVFLDDADYDKNLANPVLGLSAKELARTAARVYAANGIRVFLFADYKTTPELSFAIRYLNAVGGAMIDASHNFPTDCGKKVFDSKGGQLIPPFDQELTNEVNKNVSRIKIIKYEKAKEDNLIKSIDKTVSRAYYEAVVKLSLSKSRDLKIVYSPLHGPGLTSVYPVLKLAGFKAALDPLTKNLSGKFENVKFNIPNPEVEQSFLTPLLFAKEQKADIVLSSDPDADRIGIMVKHNSALKYLTGNEIAVLLADYAKNKKTKKRGWFITTDVTTSLITMIAQKNKLNIIDDLLVGFKYIGDEMNKLEEKKLIDDFLFACEESHGYLAGNYARDKDAAIAALWLCEIAAELKKDKRTLVDRLDDIYCEYGYYKNYLTEIRMLGADGLEKNIKILNTLRNEKLKKIGSYKINSFIDRLEGEPFLSETDKVARNILVYRFVPVDGMSIKLTVRPSGTEPKTKFYIEIGCPPCQSEELNNFKEISDQLRKKIEKEFLNYCYKIVGVDFPDRGYLLFWQLPLKQKLHYFEIERDIIELKKISDKKNRLKKLENILSFLGSDPIEKVDKAFKDKYKLGIEKYLDL